MGYIRILKVEYSGEKYYFESPSLDKSLCIIEGPNGSGKSTFFNLIHYGLGGRVSEFDPESNEAHNEIVNDSNNLVRLIVNLTGVVFTITRKIRENYITVFRDADEADGVTTELVSLTLPIYRRDDQEIFSDWILERLEIPVVDIFQGGKSFKLGFTDLSRLFYHNQSPDPHGIYKPADSANFLSDSLEIRRAIFQILVGKTLLSLYEAIGRMKVADRDAQSARTVHEEYQNIVTELLKASGLKTIHNAKSLEIKIGEIQGQTGKLLLTRAALVNGKLDNTAARSIIEIKLRAVRTIESARREIDSQRSALFDEAGRLIDLERNLKADIERINKVIYTHGQLKLFSSDTCPFCLNAVAREENKCICGHPVEERDYQRFFYSASEYLDILRSKTKSLETLRLAASGVQDELSILAFERQKLKEELASEREGLADTAYADSPIGGAVEQVDGQIFEQRQLLYQLQEALRLELKLASLQARLDQKKTQYDLAKLEVGGLDATSKIELQGQIAAFNSSYNNAMTTILARCRVAAIDSETYLPIINNGEYREASANVPKRFLYYLTLLQLSLLSDIPFPRLLLIDTPETAGIDRDNLILMLRQITALENPAKRMFQVLLSTGVGKYPPEFDQFVVLRLSDESRLLQARQVEVG